MSLKKMYYNLENKYYEFVEKTGLYKITDKIDKFMPSMIFFILLIIAVIAGILLLLPFAPGSDHNEVNFFVKSVTDQPISGVPLLITTEFGEEHSVITDQYGKTTSVFLPKNTTYTLTVDYTSFGYNTFSENYFSEKRYEEKTIVLEEASDPTQHVNYQFSVVDSSSQSIPAGTAYFACEGDSGIAPSPVSVVNGVVNVSAEESCILTATIRADGYHEVSNKPITSSTTQLVLTGTGYFAGTYDVSIYVKDTDGIGVSNIKVSAYKDYAVLQTTCITDESGFCKLEDLPSASYDIRTSDNRSPAQYSLESTQISNLSNNTERSIVVTKEVTGYILAKVNDHTGTALEDAVVYLKVVDQTIDQRYTQEDGTVLFSVSNNSLDYRVVVDVEGYMIESRFVIPSTDVPTTPTVTITLEQVSSSTAKPLSLRVVGHDGKGYPNAQVVLYNAETGLLTDYTPKKSDYDGNITFSAVRSGRYYAKAFKGSSTGTSQEFEFDIRTSQAMDLVVIPMSVSKGMLTINVVDKDDYPVSNATVNVYDIYSSYSSPIKRELTNTLGQYSVEMDADQLLYVVVSDEFGGLGTTQSEYIYLEPDGSSLKVTLYPEKGPLTQPELKYNGIYRDGSLIRDSLKAGEEYTAKYTLFVPQNRTGNDRFDNVGAIISTGSKQYLENESIYIKEINMAGSPGTTNIRKYIRYDDEDYLTTSNFEESETNDDAKWALLRLTRSYDYFSAYEIVVTLKVKDSAVFGEELNLNYIGFGETKSGNVEILFKDFAQNVSEIKKDTLNEKRLSIGDETSCDNDFCFNMVVVDNNENLRTDVIDSYTAKPLIDYTATFTLINSSSKILSNARVVIENKDLGITYDDIEINHQYGTSNVGIQENKTKYDVSITSLDPDNVITGVIDFSVFKKGETKLTIEFISDQQIVFTRTINIVVLSDNTFNVDVEPTILPAYKEYMVLEVEANDSKTDLPIIEDVYVSVKDRFKRDVVLPKLLGPTGKTSLTIPEALQPSESVYVYVSSAGYETSITEVKATDKVYKVTPSPLGVSLNVHSKPQQTINFKLTNLISNDLEIRSMVIKGEQSDIEMIDVQRVNNVLESYVGQIINGVDSQVGGEIGATKDIEFNISVNPRAEMLSEVKNSKAYLFITLGDKNIESLGWTIEVPVNITVGFEAIMDDPNCVYLSEVAWEDIVDQGYAETQFTLGNGCQINNNVVSLANGVEAKVEFDSNPLGRFTINTGQRLVELSSGYFKNIVDSVPAERTYPVLLRYEPVGRYTGDISGKIIFRSVNKTTSGEQILTTEYSFNLHVISLGDCYVLSKDVLEIRDASNADSFTIENKNCGMDVTYRLSCDDCPGIVVQPQENIVVSSTGSSQDVVVKSINAIPGMYVLYLYAKSSDGRGTEQNIGRVKVNVRPYDKCLDLDRYEMDLYRSLVSENTGEVLPASSYDTINLINKCYGQNINIEAKIKDSDRLWGSVLSGLRNGVLVGATRQIVKLLGLFGSKDQEGYEGAELNTGNVGVVCDPIKRGGLFNLGKYKTECKLNLGGFSDSQLKKEMASVTWKMDGSERTSCKDKIKCTFVFDDKDDSEGPYDINASYTTVKGEEGTANELLNDNGSEEDEDDRE